MSRFPRHGRSLLAVAVLALAGLPSCGRRDAAEDAPRAVLLVSLDTVRADAFGCVRGGGGITPRIDALAARGAVFTDCTAPSPLTLPSHASLLTGQDPLRHGARSNGFYEVASTAPLLAEELRRAGWSTAASVGSVVLGRRYGLARGFQHYFEVEQVGSAGAGLVPDRPASAVLGDAARWLAARRRDERWFLWVHLMDAHAPYDPPEPWRTRHAADRYLGEIAHVDDALGRFLDGLERAGRLEDTLVVVVADHGEDRGDHGEMTHGLFLYQSTLHVPFVVAGPGVANGLRVAEPVGLIDVAPTLREGLALPAPPAVDGASLWGVLARGEDAPGGRAFRAETLNPREEYGWSELRAWREGAVKYVEAPRPELYDLAADPGERTNRLPAESERARGLREALLMRESTLAGGAQGAPVLLSEVEREQLESLGYAGLPSVEPGTVGLPDPKDGLREIERLSAARALLTGGRPDEAEAILRELVAGNPAQAQARLLLVTVQLMRGDETAAEREAHALLAATEGAPGADRVAWRAQVALAQIAEKQGRASEALEHWDRALAAPPSDDLRLHVAALNVSAGREGRAREILAPLLEGPEGHPGRLRAEEVLRGERR